MISMNLNNAMGLTSKVGASSSVLSTKTGGVSISGVGSSTLLLSTSSGGGVSGQTQRGNLSLSLGLSLHIDDLTEIMDQFSIENDMETKKIIDNDK